MSRPTIWGEFFEVLIAGGLAGTLACIVPTWSHGFPLILASGAGAGVATLRLVWPFRPLLLISWACGLGLAVTLATVAPFKFEDRWRLNLEPAGALVPSQLTELLDANGLRVISHVDLTSSEEIQFDSTHPSLKELNLRLREVQGVEIKPFAMCGNSLSCSILRGCESYSLALVRPTDFREPSFQPTK